MKKKISVLSTMMMLSTLAVAQSAAGAASADLSPAAQSIAAAQKAISEKPTEYAGYNLLAAALVRRAQQTTQETSNAGFYAQAEDAVKKSLAMAPNNFETEKIQVSILL